MKRSTWLGLLALVLVAGAWLLSRAFEPTAAGAPVTRGKVDYTVTGSVSVLAEKESQIASPEDAIIKESHLVQGQIVQTGELLARLDPGSLPSDIKSTKLQLDTVTHELAGKLPEENERDRQQDQFNRDQDLMKAGPNMIAPVDFEKEKKALEAQTTAALNARAEKETQQAVLQNSLDALQAKLTRFDVVAPYNGTITTVVAHQGDLLPKGATLAGIISTDLRLQTEVNQEDIGNVFEKERATVKFFAYPGQVFEAFVTHIMPSSDKTTQRFTVQLELREAKINLLAGLTGVAIIYAGENDHALRIPRRALYGNSVLVAKDGRVEIRQVTPGFLTLTYAEIKPDPNPHATVAEGETVLTENLDLFRNGDRVRVTTAADVAGQK